MPAPVATGAATPANTAVPPAPSNGAVPPAPTAPAAPAAEATFEVTIDGKPQQLTRRQIEQFAGKGGYADKLIRQAKERLAEVAKDREEREKDKRTAAEKAKADTDAWLREHGIDPDAYARSKLEGKLAEHQLTPEQREAKKEKDRADQLQKQLDEKAANEKAAKQAEGTKMLQRQMENELGAAAERAGLSKDPDAFFAVYEAVKEWKRLGLPWNADAIVEHAKENIDGGFKRLEGSVLKGLKGKALVDRLGPAVVKEVLRFKAEELRGGGTRPSTPSSPAQQNGKESQFVSVQDLQQKYRGGAK